MTRGNAARASERKPYWLWLGPCLYLAAISLYYVTRYSGRWAESDSAAFTQMIRGLAQDGRLVPSTDAYPNGYLYQALSTFILKLTGLDAALLQQLVFPLLAPLVVLPAWMMYRELTDSSRSATIAIMLLLTQPEFLFVVLRSSHEKWTRVLLMLSVFWLVRSMKVQHLPRLFAIHVALFYVTIFAFITSNNLLAHSFIFALVIALVIGVVLARRKTVVDSGATLLPRFLYATLICLGLVYLFTFYVYPPAQHDLLILQNLWERVASLFLDVQSQPTNAYSTISIGWTSLPVYFMVSIANWIILGSSLMIWLRQGYAWVVRKRSGPTQTQWLLWLFYAAFAAQGALSAVADASGWLGGNLQHRLFPSFSIMAAGVVGAALARWRPRRVAVVRVGFALVLAGVALLSVLKATNEPLLSNKWTFYQPAELTALEWTNRYVQNSLVWTEFDERLEMSMLIARGRPAKTNISYGAAQLLPGTRDMVLSDITRLRSRRLQTSIPLPLDALRVYDNGAAQVYHFRPVTSYQR